MGFGSDPRMSPGSASLSMATTSDEATRRNWSGRFQAAMNRRPPRTHPGYAAVIRVLRQLYCFATSGIILDQKPRIAPADGVVFEDPFEAVLRLSESMGSTPGSMKIPIMANRPWRWVVEDRGHARCCRDAAAVRKIMKGAGFAACIARHTANSCAAC
jgi:hypothetical protein